MPGTPHRLGMGSRRPDLNRGPLHYEGSIGVNPCPLTSMGNPQDRSIHAVSDPLPPGLPNPPLDSTERPLVPLWYPEGTVL